MWALWRKETSALLHSLIAYLIWAVFLVGTGLFLWVFSGSVIQTGAAEMDVFFSIAPWFLLFLAPALTMRSFSEEFRVGTYELLATAPISPWEILWGKYLAVAVVLAFALVPTLVFYGSIAWLAQPRGAVDHGAIQGAYVGLFLMGLALVALGIWASTLTMHTIIAFLLALFMGFLWLIGFEFISELPIGKPLQVFFAQLSLMEHYRSISRGVVDSRDILYFLGVILFGLGLARLQLSQRHA
ncbi:MAG: ABC transporter permease subunit [Bacteroidia bacterium]|jgi:ABC-2 type transport system permease protein|nr:ABC transporter permease subunit [Bacteroidia bacterium]GIV23204.1 MAG: gliding motility-associated ABC transporter permease subunit GldF [Bacteroidia bacterium]